MTGTTSSQAVWYLTRGTGIVSLILLTAVTVLGILNTVRWSPAMTPRFVVQRVHRNLSLVSVVFIVVHIATAVIDGFAPIRWIDAVIPFRSAYRPLWLGLGTLAFDLLIAVAVSSLLRARLGYRAWRAIHWTSYALWGVAVFHGLGIGSDAKQVWMIALTAACVGAVIAAVVWRLTVGWPGWTPARLSMTFGVFAMPLVLVVWFVGGPLRPGWAERAGTPKQLLARTSQPASPASPPSAAPATLRQIVLPSQATGSGTTILHRLEGNRARVVVSLRTQGSPELTVRVVLNGTQISQGISMSDGSVVLTPPGGAAPYTGSVTALSGGNIGANLSDGHGDEIALSMSLQIGSSGETQAQVFIRGLATGSAQV
jgi:Ferric reductase like transmembrane component